MSEETKICLSSGKHQACSICHHNGQHERTAACSIACNKGGVCITAEPPKKTE